MPRQGGERTSSKMTPGARRRARAASTVLASLCLPLSVAVAAGVDLGDGNVLFPIGLALGVYALIRLRPAR